MTQNVFDRVQLNALVGAWSGLPFNLTTNSLDWWHAPYSGSSLTAGAKTKSLPGASLITPSAIGGDSRSTYFPGGNSWHTWTDETSGAAPQDSGNVSSTPGVGRGFRLTYPTPKWPDWRELWVWIFTSNPTQLTFTASMNDSNAVTQTVGIGGAPDTYGDNDAFKNLGTLVIKVKSATDSGTSKTTTLDMVTNGSSMGSFGLVAAALYRSPPTVFPQRAQALSYIATGGAGPMGSR